MHSILDVKSDLERVFDRRILRAPTEFRRRFSTTSHIMCQSYLLEHTLILYVGSRGAIKAAADRSSTYSNPFPGLFGEFENNATVYATGKGTTISQMTMDVSANPLAFCICLNTNSSVTIYNLGVRAFGSIEYHIDFAVAYRGSTASDALLFGPEEIEASVVRFINDYRLFKNANYAG
jgi:hypothetical protein